MLTELVCYFRLSFTYLIPYNKLFMTSSVCTGKYRTSLAIDDLELEYCEHCKCDYLDVYDGEDSTAVKLGRYCKGNVRLFSTRQKMFIVFHADSKIGGKGFAAAHKNVLKNEGKLFFGGGRITIRSIFYKDLVHAAEYFLEIWVL